jgi:hypothetical protein
MWLVPRMAFGDATALLYVTLAAKLSHVGEDVDG